MAGALKYIDKIRKLPCVACGASFRVEAHHIRTRGAGGGDEPTNLISLCSGCHTQEPYAWHRSREKFFKKFPHVKLLLEKMGWEFFNGKCFRPKTDL